MNKARLQKLSYPKAIFTVLLAMYGFICAKNPAAYHIIDGVNLITHEAGHLLFGHLGEFITVVGGTAGQLFVPIALTAYFIAKQTYYSAAATLFWLGQNMFNISVYIKDASVMELSLVNVGGGEGIHDWNYILLKFGLLPWDRTLGNIVFGAGLAIIRTAIMLGFFFSFEDISRKSKDS